MTNSKTTPIRLKPSLSESIAEMISLRLGIMTAGGKQFVGWDDGGFDYASKLIQEALDNAFNDGAQHQRDELLKAVQLGKPEEP
jgi:hypothetical protein